MKARHRYARGVLFIALAISLLAAHLELAAPAISRSLIARTARRFRYSARASFITRSNASPIIAVDGTRPVNNSNASAAW